ncbi:MAG TPA: RseA family anti-sigma factor [Steroidobacteraceae bacterium]|jgi:negative regulator of sigma E activity|nr:RseA family anti-sigma factor [Steroidobacteraceae bacterium]
MSNEELDSQLSAMFDDELPATECELLARRLARDEQLRGRWGRYAAIGACIRGEHGVRLGAPLASKVSAALTQEATAAPANRPPQRLISPWITSLAGLATAAGVAAVAILWIRTQGPVVVAQTDPAPKPAVQVHVPATPAAATQVAATPTRPRTSREPDSYVVPAAAVQEPALVAPTELANYIVAHSVYSGPLMRRNALSALVGGDSAVPLITAQPIAATVVTGK